MTITLAATWHPRGETLRFRRLYPFLARLYDHIEVVVPPTTHAGMILSFRVYNKITLSMPDDWSTGRHTALQQALNRHTDYIHYADLDRLIRWAETQPEELVYAVDHLQTTDCLVLGRTQAAYETHPRALIETETLPNRVFSHILGLDLDLSAGSKGFRHDVARYILQHAVPGHALGTDAEWIILAKRGGYQLDQLRVNGLDWESADRYQRQAADADQQRHAAADYDADPKNWTYRVQVASEIITVGLETLKRPLI
jgi:hypothetical protein